MTARWLSERGIETSAFVCFRVPRHEQKPFSGPLKIAIPARGIYYGLGDVVPGFDPRVARHAPEFVFRQPLGATLHPMPHGSTHRPIR